MIRCGSQCLTCDYPINFDTYMGCSHACKYCYVKRKYSIKNVEPIKMAKKIQLAKRIKELAEDNGGIVGYYEEDDMFVCKVMIKRVNIDE